MDDNQFQPNDQNQPVDPNQQYQQQPYQQQYQQVDPNQQQYQQPYQQQQYQQPYQQPYQQQYQQPFQAPMNDPGKGMAIASLVLGICSIVFSWVPIGNIIMSVIGLILGVIAQKKQREVGASTGMAVAGMVLSILTLVWAVACTIICISACAAANPYYWWYW